MRITPPCIVRKLLHAGSSAALGRVLVLLGELLAAAASAHGEHAARCVCPAAEAWLVSTRDLPDCIADGDSRPRYWRLAADGQCTAADEAAFLAAQRPALPTVIHIHGNRTTACDAIAEGLEFRRELACLEPGAEFRFVIWSWPADRVAGRVRRDVLLKDVRSQWESVYLARTLARLRPDVPICLVGYSFGAQTIAGALELLAGGCYAGHVLPRAPAPRKAPLRAVLVAAAMDNAALASPDPARSPLSQVDRVLVTHNGCDPALKLYPRICRPHGPQALGYTGPICLDPQDPNAQKVEVVDVSCAVGKRHGWCYYRNASPLVARLAWYAFAREGQATSPAIAAAR